MDEKGPGKRTPSFLKYALCSPPGSFWGSSRSLGTFANFEDQVHNPQAEFYLARAEVHVQAVVDRAMMLGIAESERHFQKWMLSRL